MSTPAENSEEPRPLAVAAYFPVLRRWNLALALLHGLQAILVLSLATDFSIGITSTFPVGPPGAEPPSASELFLLPIGLAVALFLLLAAGDHLVTATLARGTYEADLRRGINRFRWVEYSFSATLMLILIASYVGITDITSVVTIAGANIAMILCGWLQESSNPPDRTRTTFLPFWIGTIAGITPWIAIAINVVGSKTVPGFVYGIVIAQFIFFFSFGLNQWLQYRGIGKWAHYGYGERTYLILSLIAKSVLAWQIFGGSLAG